MDQDQEIEKRQRISENHQKSAVSAASGIYILSRFLHDHDCHCHIDGFVYMLQAECLVENEAIISDADTLLKKVQHSGRAHTLREKQVQEIKKMFCGLRSAE